MSLDAGIAIVVAVVLVSGLAAMLATRVGRVLRWATSDAELRALYASYIKAVNDQVNVHLEKASAPNDEWLAGIKARAERQAPAAAAGPALGQQPGRTADSRYQPVPWEVVESAL